MKLLVLACLAAVVSADAEAEADPYYLGSYGYGSYYSSFQAVPANPAVPMATTNSLVSSQYHAQDEDKNFSFGYSNINSARHEAGNAYTGVTGSYTDGRHTVNYVADVYGFRRI